MKHGKKTGVHSQTGATLFLLKLANTEESLEYTVNSPYHIIFQHHVL